MVYLLALTRLLVVMLCFYVIVFISQQLISDLARLPIQVTPFHVITWTLCLMKIYMLLILRQNYCACETSLTLINDVVLKKDDLNDLLSVVLCE